MIVGILIHALLRKRSLKSRIAYKSCTWPWRENKGIYLSEDSSEANEHTFLLGKDGMINRSPTFVSEWIVCNATIHFRELITVCKSEEEMPCFSNTEIK